MAGTVTVVENRTGTAKKIKWSWTSDASGNADLVTSFPYDGEIIGLTTVPSGVAAPTDNYDITITDDDGDDVLLGTGQNRSATLTQFVSTGLAVAANKKLTLNVSNAGNAKAGTTILYIR
jgi:hypothetical protein